MLHIIKFDYAVTVAGGNGSQSQNSVRATVNYGFKISNICIKAPSESATYDIKVLDSDGYVVYHETGRTGSGNIPTWVGCDNTLSVSILNSSVDGNFSVRLYLEN